MLDEPLVAPEDEALPDELFEPDWELALPELLATVGSLNAGVGEEELPVPLPPEELGGFVAAAGCGATLNDADAKPPVGREAVIVYAPGEDGACRLVENPPPELAVTDTDPVGPLTVMAALLGKYEPYTLTVPPAWYDVLSSET